MIIEGFAVEFLKGARYEVLQTLLSFLMDEYYLCIVLALPDATIQCHTVNPAGDVCLRDPAP